MDHDSNLQRLAPHLNDLEPISASRVFYDLFADGLVWSDEIPDPDLLLREDLSIQCLRGIWRYRTCLILGIPGERFQKRWEEGQRLFPKWPGFLPERRDPKWAKTYEAQNQAAVRGWEEADELFERQRQGLNGPAQPAKVGEQTN